MKCTCCGRRIALLRHTAAGYDHPPLPVYGCPNCDVDAPATRPKVVHVERPVFPMHPPKGKQ